MPKADHSTLWEGEELALRYLLEDGKLNLCLRLLDDYTKCMLLTSNPSFFADAAVEPTLSDGSKAHNLQVNSVADLSSLENFEFGVCTTLHNVWQHSEAIQTTDLPLMLAVTRRMLLAHKHSSTFNFRNKSVLATFCGLRAAGGAAEGKAADAPPAESTPRDALLEHKPDLGVEDSCSAFAHQFLGDIGAHLAHLNLQMDSIWGALQRGNILGAWLVSCLQNPVELPDPVLLAGARGIAGLVHCEEFQMRRDAVLAATLPTLAAGTEEDAAGSEGKIAESEAKSVMLGLAELSEAVLPRLSTSAAVKKSIRPLLDLAAYCKRQAKKSRK